MIFIFGKRTVRIARYLDTDQLCYPCKAYDREISVYRDYIHFCFIPVFPVGARRFKIRCRNCGDDTRTDSLVRKYGPQARTPVYLYAAPILTMGIALFWFYWNDHRQKEKQRFVSQPLSGDIYTMQEEQATGKNYYFLKLVAVKSDSVLVLRSDLYYTGFVSKPADKDYFVTEDTLAYSRSRLQRMLNDDEIYAIRRESRKGRGGTR